MVQAVLPFCIPRASTFKTHLEDRHIHVCMCLPAHMRTRTHTVPICRAILGSAFKGQARRLGDEVGVAGFPPAGTGENHGAAATEEADADDSMQPMSHTITFYENDTFVVDDGALVPDYTIRYNMVRDNHILVESNYVFTYGAYQAHHHV